MGYGIYYDKRFLKVGDKICPLVQSGSNNCWEVSYPRDIPEKRWEVMNYHKPDKLLFDPDELKKDYETETMYQESYHKSRYKYHEDFSKWLIAGIKNAMTIEEHVQLRNPVQVFGWIRKGENSDRKNIVVATTDEFLLTLEILNTMGAEQIDVAFVNRNINAKKRPKKERVKTDYSTLDTYYVIKHKDGDIFFSRFLKWGYRYTYYLNSSYTKKFKAQKDAQKYLESNWSRLKDYIVHEIRNKKNEESDKEKANN